MISLSLSGMQEVVRLSGDPQFLKTQVALLESAVNESPELAIDISRAIVETVCKTILLDRGITVQDKWLSNTPTLFENTLDCLMLLPDEHRTNTKAKAGVDNLCKGLNNLLLGICQIRNAFGNTSHGKDSYTPAIDPIYAHLAARAADSLVNFLYRAHRLFPANASKRRLFLEDNKAFNEYLDEIFQPVEVMGLVFRMSEVLFNVDSQAYREALIEYESDALSEDNKD